MSLNNMTKAFLVLLCFALCLTAQPSTAAPGSEKITGRLLDGGTRAPLAGEIGVSYISKGKIIFTHAKATADGRFVINDVEAGKVYLTTKLDGYAVEHRSISLRPGETRAVELSLVKPASLRGIVRNPDGLPLAGATVRVLYPVDTPGIGEIRTTYQWETGQASSDTRGTFVIPVHPEKSFIVEASHPDFLSAVSAPRQIKAMNKVETVALALESGVTLSGILKDADGNAIQGAQVRLIETGARRAIPGFVSDVLLEQQFRLSSTGADGAFRFDKVSPTTKMVVVIHPGYKPFRQAVNVTQNKAQSPFRAVLEPRN
jgi:hypothetical protein